MLILEILLAEACCLQSLQSGDAGPELSGLQTGSGKA